MLRAPRRALRWAIRPLRPLGRGLRLVGGVFHGGRGRVLRAAVVVVLAAVGSFLYIRQTRVDTKLLDRLVITGTALREVPAKAVLSQPIAASQSTFAATRKAARRDPDATGMYAREWYVSSSGPPEVGVVLQLLPDDATARTVYSAVVKELKTAPTLTGETATAAETFSVPGVAVSRGVSYVLDDSTTSAHAPVGTSYTVAYRVGRTVVSELMVTTSTVRDNAAVDTDTRAGARILALREPGFSMVRSHWPWEATLIYAGGAVVVAAALVFAPEFLVGRSRRRRQRHQERELRRAREQYLVRGRRTVRRQRAPAWSQSRRR